MECFFLPSTAGIFDFSVYDYVVDAIDTVTGKLAIIEMAKAALVPVISSMGAGNKLDPTAFEVADLYSTSVCPLAKIMRRECKKRGITSLKVVYSKEKPRKPCGGLPEFGEAREDSEGEENKGAGNRKDLESSIDPGNTQIGLLTEAAEDESKKAARRRDIPGSTAFVPSAAGLIIAGEVIADLTGIR